MYKVLTIAGSDCSGGAGIQADLKTMSAHHCYGMSAITALTAQNTNGVVDIHEPPAAFLGLQLECVFSDIFPDAVKVGMVSNVEIIEIIAEKCRAYEAKNIVVDPVMIATSGSELMHANAVRSLEETLFPIASVITPNQFEAGVLAGIEVVTQADMERAAAAIADYYDGYILVKGGHSVDNADDLLWRDGEAQWLRGDHIDNENTHGTGCTLSSAIACRLAQGHSMYEACRLAKMYLTRALKANLNLGQGRGPMQHHVAVE